MRTFIRHTVVLAAVLLLALPARAVVPQKDFQTTLGSLLGVETLLSTTILSISRIWTELSLRGSR